MTVSGSGSAKSVIASMPPRASAGRSRRAATSATRGRRAATASAVNTRLTRERSRAWSGLSVKTSDFSPSRTIRRS